MELKPGYKQTELGVIPEEWESTTVGDIASSARNAIVGGPFGSDLVSIDYVDDGVPVIRGQNMGQRSISGSFVFVTSTKAKSLEANLARPSDIVFTQRGTLGHVSLVPEAPYDAYLISQSQMKLTVSRAVADPLFFYYAFSSSEQQEYIRKNTIQTGVPHINLGILRRIPVQRPPLPEQRAIAAALEDVDALLGALTQLIAKKRDLKQAAMQQLLTGQIRLPGFSGEWEVKLLGECLTARPDYGINAPAVPFSDRLPMYIRITDISDDGRFSLGTPVSVKAPSADQYYLSDGDVVFARTGASVGKSYLHSPRDGRLVFAGFLIRVRPDPSRLVPAFLAAYVKTSTFWNWVRFMSTRSGQPGINGNEFAQLPVPAPPVPEQTAIAAVLSDMDAELVVLEARLAKTHALKQGMMQELLTGRTRLV